MIAIQPWTDDESKLGALMSLINGMALLLYQGINFSLYTFSCFEPYEPKLNAFQKDIYYNIKCLREENRKFFLKIKIQTNKQTNNNVWG